MKNKALVGAAICVIWGVLFFFVSLGYMSDDNCYGSSCPPFSQPPQVEFFAWLGVILVGTGATLAATHVMRNWEDDGS